VEPLGPISLSDGIHMSETVTRYSQGQLELWAQILRDSGRYAVLERNRVLKLTVTKSVDAMLLESFKDYAEKDRFMEYVLGSAGHELGHEMVRQGATVRSERRAEDYRHEYTFTAHVVLPK
jgi:hypothetical protein